MSETPAPRWRTASHSGPNGDCVEVAVGAHQVDVRDTKDRATTPQHYSHPAWQAFTQRLRSA